MTKFHFIRFSPSREGKNLVAKANPNKLVNDIWFDGRRPHIKYINLAGPQDVTVNGQVWPLTGRVTFDKGNVLEVSLSKDVATTILGHKVTVTKGSNAVRFSGADKILWAKIAKATTITVNGQKIPIKAKKTMAFDVWNGFFLKKVTLGRSTQLTVNGKKKRVMSGRNLTFDKAGKIIWRAP